MAAEYVFLDEWDVDAPQERVFDALVDARTYPEWWTPVYRQVDSDGPPAVGCSSRQKFKANLPYTLSTSRRSCAWTAPTRSRWTWSGTSAATARGPHAA